MGKRHADAIAIQLGACNPSGIAHSIVAACAEMRAAPNHNGTLEIRNDPAIRLMVHQLAYLCNVREIDDSLTCYGELTGACNEAIKVKEESA